LSRAADNRRGIVAMLTAMTLFTGNDALLKIATAGLPPGQIMATRGAFGILLALALVIALGEARHLRELASPVVALRAALEAAVAFTFITALAALKLANITAILQATPIVLTVLAVLLGLERVGWRRWCAILVGFLGVLLVVKPDPGGFNLAAGLALLSATLVAVRDLVTRSIAGHVPTVVVGLSTTTAVTLLGLALTVGEDWRSLALREVALLALAAGFVTLGNLAIIRAYRIGEMSAVSPFRYTVILTSLAVGYLAFGELPDATAVAGIALIVLSGVYAIHRDTMRRQADGASGAASPAPAGPPAGERP
jgi:drug/metabolite transporter (DMT)-like permease